jgi:D-amino peptidase
MTILVSADMEGATGVTWPAEVEPGTEQWQRCRAMFTSDVNGAIAGFLDGGADEVLVNEAHATMRNLLLESLDKRASVITGRHKDLTMVEGIQHADVDAVAFVGYHTGAGTVNAQVAAEFGVPVFLVTGDDRTCADAATYAPQAHTVAVKDYVSRYAAVCRPPARTFADIRAGAKAATASAERHEPVSAGPFTVEVEVDSVQLVTNACMVPSVERTGERRVAYSAVTAYEMIRCFKAVTTLIASAVEATYG